MEDTARLLTAIHLGLSVTAALLLAATLRASSRRLAPSALVLAVALAGTAAALARGESRTATALDGLALLAALLAPAATRPGRAFLRATPPAALLAAPALRLAGLDARVAERAGWLPHDFASTTVVIEGTFGAGALVAAALAARGARGLAITAWSALGLVGAFATWALAWRSVRPLPAFEALYLGAALPIAAAAHAAALLRQRGDDGDA